MFTLELLTEGTDEYLNAPFFFHQLSRGMILGYSVSRSLSEKDKLLTRTERLISTRSEIGITPSAFLDFVVPILQRGVAQNMW